MFGLVSTGHLIYVIGGYKFSNIYSCERFDVLKEHWTELPVICKLPGAYSVGVNYGVFKQRFIYGFGGMNHTEKTPDSSTENIYKLDTLKLKNGW